MEKTNSKIEGEANNLLNLYYDASVFPDSIKKDIQETIREYVYDVTTSEWKEMADGKADSAAAKHFVRLNRIYLSIKSSDVANVEVLTQSMENMKDVREYRRHRLLSSKQSMPDILWFVLILSTIMIVAFTFFFSVKNIWLNNTMISFLIFVSVLVMYLVYVMDHPYVGVDAIKPDAFQPLMDIVNRMGK
jgi:cation transport ATPase